MECDPAMLLPFVTSPSNPESIIELSSKLCQGSILRFSISAETFYFILKFRTNVRQIFIKNNAFKFISSSNFGQMLDRFS
jgi:hypothetical protein